MAKEWPETTSQEEQLCLFAVFGPEEIKRPEENERQNDEFRFHGLGSVSHHSPATTGFLRLQGLKLDVCAAMNVDADHYITKPVAKADLLSAIRSRLERAIQQAVPHFKPNLHSAVPLYAKYDVHLEPLPA